MIIEITKMILTIKVIVIITIIITKCRDRYRTLTTTNTELPVTLHNGQKPLSNNIKKSSPSDAVTAVYTSLKRLIRHWNFPPLDFSRITVTVYIYIYILDDPDKNLLNKRSEIISQCRHKNKYRLKTLASSMTSDGIT